METRGRWSARSSAAESQQSRIYQFYGRPGCFSSSRSFVRGPAPAEQRFRPSAARTRSSRSFADSVSARVPAWSLQLRIFVCQRIVETPPSSGWPPPIRARASPLVSTRPDHLFAASRGHRPDMAQQPLLVAPARPLSRNGPRRAASNAVEGLSADPCFSLGESTRLFWRVCLLTSLRSFSRRPSCSCSRCLPGGRRASSMFGGGAKPIDEPSSCFPGPGRFPAINVF